MQFFLHFTRPVVDFSTSSPWIQVSNTVLDHAEEALRRCFEKTREFQRYEILGFRVEHSFIFFVCRGSLATCTFRKLVSVGLLVHPERFGTHSSRRREEGRQSVSARVKEHAQESGGQALGRVGHGQEDNRQRGRNMDDGTRELRK